ncbi:MAG TPA: hypothetical protein VFB58_09490 [Chloroflexota bacterium]|nr:hypothetical protein [Chloroflexota bacterium]
MAVLTAPCGKRVQSVRIVIGNAPQAYRESLAAVVGALRPEIEVIIVAPDDLDDAVVKHSPDFVVCSRLTPAVETRAAAWAVLYPGGTGASIVSVRGMQSVMSDMGLDALLAGLDGLAG